jgi:serine/threonine-protein kinase
VNRQTFFDNLRQSRLLGDEQFAAVRERFDKGPIQAVVAALADEGLLTSFQVKQLWAGQTKGLVLGQYRVLDELGRGGYGCVYKARHSLMDRVVALKVISPELVGDDRVRTWFRREVLAATQLNHPNIALAYDADEVDGTLFFAMEYIDGPNLETFVRKQGPLPIGLACELMQQTAKALQYAHEKRMVHRDIKPANLLIPRGAVAEIQGNAAAGALAAGPRPTLVKVVDFGLARLQGQSTSKTLILQKEGSFVGTPDYVSPEQARNIHQVDIRSDLYSLGCTLYFALSGHRPFKADSVLEIIVQHLEKQPVPLEQHRPEIPPALASIIRRLMSKKPEKRFQTPTELLGELSFFYGAESSRPNIALPATPLAFGSAVAAAAKPRTAFNFPGRAETAHKDEQDTDSVEHLLPPTLLVPAAGGESPPPQQSALEELAPPSQQTQAPAVTESELPADSHHADDYQASALAGEEVVAAAAPAAATDSTGPRQFAVDPALIGSWKQWSGLVELLLQGRPLELGDAEYRDLHRALLQSCRCHLSRAAEVEQQLFQRIESVVEPWLNPQTLAAMDPETLSSLSLRCRQIDAVLGVSRKSILPLVLTLLALAVAAAVGWLLMQVPTRRWADLSSPAAWWRFAEANPILSMAVVLLLMVVLSIPYLSRLFRT